MGKLRNGKYRDITGELKPVGGDMTKLRHVPTLGDAARKVLYNVEARTRHIPGTHEVRKTMRHQTHANRVCYGTAIFITFSPSERDTSLMVRLTRARQCDPAVHQDGSAPFQRRTHPQLDVDYMRLSPEALAEARQQQFHCMFICAKTITKRYIINNYASMYNETKHRVILFTHKEGTSANQLTTYIYTYLCLSVPRSCRGTIMQSA